MDVQLAECKRPELLSSTIIHGEGEGGGDEDPRGVRARRDVKNTETLGHLKKRTWARAANFRRFDSVGERASMSSARRRVSDAGDDEPPAVK